MFVEDVTIDRSCDACRQCYQPKGDHTTNASDMIVCSGPKYCCRGQHSVDALLDNDDKRRVYNNEVVKYEISI